ncbi:MAG: pseudouridylate synthase, partial [Flavobacteriales bacterium]
MSRSYFNPFKSSTEEVILPVQMNNPFEVNIPEIALLAAHEVQAYLSENQQLWQHDFGFDAAEHESVRGKMFGVLVVQNLGNELGYLFTSSGKINSETQLQFVPSVFTGHELDQQLSKGMLALTKIGRKIQHLDAINTEKARNEAAELRMERKTASHELQQWIFDQYQFTNSRKQSKSLKSIFTEYSGKTPPAGAGECAAPKLLQHAFQNNLKPL